MVTSKESLSSENARLYRVMERRNKVFQEFGDFCKDISQCTTIEALGDFAVGRIYLLLQAHSVVLALHDPMTNLLRVTAERHEDKSTPQPRTVRTDRGLIGQCYRERRYLFKDLPPRAGANAKSSLVARAVPLVAGGDCKGVLAVTWLTEYGDIDLSEQNFLRTAAMFMTGMLRNMELNEERERRLRNVTIAREMGARIASTLDMDEVFSLALRGACEALEADIASLMLIDRENQVLRIHASTGLPDEVVKDTAVPLGDSISGYVAREGIPVMVDDVEQDRRFERSNNPRYGTKMALCAPLRSKRGVIGVLNVNASQPRRVFTHHDLDMITILSQQASTAIENAELHGEVTRMATTDELTGLCNRRAFFEALETELQRASRYKHGFGLLIMDLDHFKGINDNHGHLAGDAVLRGLGRLLLAQLREVDVVGRYGGEEFAVLLPQATTATATECAERLRAAVRRELRVPDAEDHTITVSIGVAVFPCNATDPTPLVQCADDALYRAKNDGRDRVVVADVADAPAASASCT